MSEAAHQGQCRCGEVHFAVTSAPLVTMACHCRGCQAMSASAFSLSSLYPADRFELVSGAPERGGVGSGPTHMFCRSCMTWLYTVPEGMDDFVNVRSSLLDNAGEHRPFIETYRAEALGWAESGAARTFDTVPEDAEFGELIAAYGEWDGRVKQ